AEREKTRVGRKRVGELSKIVGAAVDLTKGIGGLSCGRVDDDCPTVTIAGCGKVGQRIITLESNAGCMRSVTYSQGTRRVVARIADLRIRTCGDVREVDLVSDSELTADLATEARRVVNSQSAGGPSERYGPRIRRSEFQRSTGRDHQRLLVVRVRLG